MRKLLASLALVLATVGVGVGGNEVKPVAALSDCGISWALYSGGHYYKLYATCYAWGGPYTKMQAKLWCSNGGIYYGNVVTAPGQQSSRTCPSPYWATQGGTYMFN